MCYFRPQLPNSCCRFTSLQWGSTDEDTSHIREHLISGLLTCGATYRQVYTHISLCYFIPNLLSIALLSCCVWQGVTWLISECPFSVLLPLEFNILWGAAWYKQKHETVFGPSHTASINWLTPPVLLSREILNSLSFCPLQTYNVHVPWWRWGCWVQECVLRSS